MQTKPLLYGLIGFFMGGFIVSAAAITFNKPNEQANTNTSMPAGMQMPANSLKDKSGNDFDATFISEMITHHQDAIDMAKLSAANAKHDEIKQLSNEIISAQEKEISQMKQWQKDWGYSASSNDHNNTSR